MMSPIDIRTLMLSQLLTDAICLAVVIYLWLSNRRRYNGLFYWVLDITFQTAAMLLISLRGLIPDWMSFETANFQVIAGAIAGFIGLEQFFGKKSRRVNNYLLLAAFMAVYIYFVRLRPNLEYRNLAISTGLLLISLQYLVLIYRRVSPHQRRSANLVGAAFFGFSLTSLLRIVLIITNPNPGIDFFKLGLYDALILLSYQLLIIIFIFGLVLMVNQRLLHEIRFEEEKFSKAFQSSLNAVSLTRLSDGEILDINEGFTKITGYKPQEAIGKTTQDLRLWKNAEDRSTVTSELAKMQTIRNKEYQFRRKNGRIITGLISCDVIMINDQPWVLSSIDDISDRKRNEKALKVYAENLEEMVDKRTRDLQAAHEKLARHERLVLLGQLAGSIGHELRAPLGVMGNAIYLLKMAQPKTNLKIREYQDIIQKEIMNADKIISDLLNFSRIKSEDRTHFSASEICSEVLERFKPPKNVEVLTRIPPELPAIFADRQQIVQVLGNLVVNGYQAMKDGGMLTISAIKKGRYINITVKDTGVGIPLKHMEQLFDPLFTTKPRGIGLGLTVSKMLIEANGGKITVASQEGKGSAFSVTIPAERKK